MMNNRFIFAAVLVSLNGMPCSAADDETKQSDRPPRTQLDEAGLPKSRLSKLEVLLFAASLPSERQKAVADVYRLANQNQAAVVAQLSQVWIEEIKDYPELAQCGMQGKPVPSVLISNDEQIERLRVNTYARLAGYAAPPTSPAPAHKHKLEYYKGIESPLIDGLNLRLIETDAKVKALLTKAEITQLLQVREHWNEQSRGLTNTAIPAPPVKEPQKVPTGNALLSERRRKIPHRPNHSFNSISDVQILTNSDLYFGRYARMLSYRLGDRWSYTGRELGDQYKCTAMKLTLNRSGNIIASEIENSSGDPTFDARMVEAVKNANGAGVQDRLPPGAPDTVQALVKFEYNLTPPKFGTVGVKALNNPGEVTDHYAKDLKKNIEKCWLAPRTGVNSRDVTISVSFAKDGTLTGVMLSESSGEIDLDQSALDAAKASLLKRGHALPPNSDKLVLQVTFHFDVATRKHSLVSYVAADEVGPDLEDYALAIQQKLQSAWHVPASAGKKHRRVVLELDLPTQIATGTTMVFTSGDIELDGTATGALRGGTYTTTRPENLPLGTKYEITFDYD